MPQLDLSRYHPYDELTAYLEAVTRSGRSNELSGQTGASDQARKLEWTVRAPAGSVVLGLVAVAQRAGTARASLRLG